MRLLLRIIGTWGIGLAVILIVIDGTKSLGANTLILTPLGDTWSMLGAPSLEVTREFIATRFFNALLLPAFETVLTFPTFAVIGVPAILLALLGRKPSRERYLRHDQI
jgi:hypothetical protein